MGKKVESNSNILSTLYAGLAYAATHPVHALVNLLAVQAVVFGVAPAAARPIATEPARDYESMGIHCWSRVANVKACDPAVSRGFYIKHNAEGSCWEGKTSLKPFGDESKAVQSIRDRNEDLSHYNIRQFNHNPNYSEEDCSKIKHYQNLVRVKP